MQERPVYALALHGGAGTILKENMPPEKEQAYRKVLNKALAQGEEILAKGGNSIDAVEATIVVLEDSPLFNAAKGAVYTHDGKHELDASIMDGKTKNAGAISGATIIKNPIKAARLVMDLSDHVLLSGPGADAFALKHGLESVENNYFDSPFRFQQLQEALAKDQITLDHKGDQYFGTVGAVALDMQGNLAAATSTGGMTNKRFGRIGDSPIIGAGTYADNTACGVSTTGHGEYFLRNLVAYDLVARMQYLGESLEKAADHIINKKLAQQKGRGGLIAIDRHGNINMPFNTAGMHRGFVKSTGEKGVFIYQDG